MKLASAWTAVTTKGHNKDIDLASHLASTEQDKLYQAPILKNCLQSLIDKKLIEEAYLRGSFRNGWADEHSDVDLFSVVQPENMEAALNDVRTLLGSCTTMITECYDRYVPDYGGIGFTFLCKDAASGHVLQFDFYMAIKGVRGECPLVDVPRIYSRNPSYRWTDDTTAVKTTDHLSPACQTFLNGYKECNDPAARALLSFDEFMSVMHYFHKHDARKQTGRIIKDDAFLVSCTLSILQEVIGWDLGDSSPLYDFNHIINICKKHGDAELALAAQRIECLVGQTATQQKMNALYAVTKDVFMQAFPEKYETVAQRIEMFEEHILRKPLAPPPSPPAPPKKDGGYTGPWMQVP